MRRSTALFIAAAGACLTAALPIISVNAAAIISALAVCRLDQGFDSNCVVFGAQLGPTLVEMSWAGMALALTIWYVPVAIGMVVWGFVLRTRSKISPSRDPNVNSAFWTTNAAVMLAPFAWKISVVLILVTVCIIWRDSRLVDR